MKNKLEQDNFTGTHVLLIILFFFLVILGLIVDNKSWLVVISAASIPCLLLWLVYAYTKEDLGSVKLSLIWGVLGTSLLVFGIYADKSQINQNILTIIINLASTLLSLAVIGVILQLKDTKEYFASTLSDLIMRESYVEKLNRPQLEKLQKTILERYFENSSDFNRENSFYKFFSKNLQSHIGSPYRENYRNTISIERTDLGVELGGCLVTDELSYQIRCMGPDLQKNIYWRAAKDEIKKLTKFQVFIGIELIFSWPPQLDQDSSSEFIVHTFSADPEDGVNLCIDLEKIAQTNAKIKDAYVDGASIKISTKYVATNYKSITAKLLFATKGFSLSVFHSNDIRCKVEPYGIDEEVSAYEYNHTKQGFTLTYQDWVLPYSGVYVAIETVDVVGEKNHKNEEKKDDSTKSNIQSRKDTNLVNSNEVERVE